MRNEKISFKQLLGVACSPSHKWLKRNRKKGLRWIVTTIYTRGLNGVFGCARANVMVPIDKFICCDETSSTNIYRCAKRLKKDIYSKKYINDSNKQLAHIFAMFDKYNVCDEFVD